MTVAAGLFPRLSGARHTGLMRPASVFFAILGGCALVASVALEVAMNSPANVVWGFIGPGLFYTAGLAGVGLGQGRIRGPGRPVAAWLLAVGALFMVDVAFGDALYDAPIASSPAAWLVALASDWAGNASVVAGIGLIGFFPTGAPDRRGERAALWAVGSLGAALPVLLLTASLAPPSELFQPAQPGIVSPLYQAVLDPVEPVLAALQFTFPVWSALGVILLYLRYRRSPSQDRSRIRWLLAGMTSALVTFAALSILALLSSGALATAAVFVLWGIAVILVLTSLAAALSVEGLLGIDRSARRALVYRVLWALIAVSYVATATALGILASRYLSAGVAMLLAAGAALAFQPAQRRLERLADRWVFGKRLDGYQVITRFGAMLEAAPGPDDLLPRLADAIRQGLAVQWARVRLDLGPMPSVVASSGLGEGAGREAHAACVVPLVYAGTTLGSIECGPRRDGPLLAEDRRLLATLAAQAATTASNMSLTAQLSDRLDVIRRQADDLAASRARLVQAQHAERRRIQRDLHDGAQQDVVVLTATLALARERLRRGDPRADETLTQLQRDLVDLLARLRELAHAIHPPVLADSGLLEAIEAQATRLPLEVVIEADPALRGVRYSEHIESTTWYLVSEALTNVVKHARAEQVRISLTQPDGLLTVEVSDNGQGFAPASARGLGLAGLADRISTAGGTLLVDSQPGRGTTVHAEIPLAAGERLTTAQDAANA
jgi:signal transduction histidine kinase